MNLSDIIFAVLTIIINGITLYLFILYAYDTWNLSKATFKSTNENSNIVGVAVETVEITSKTLEEHIRNKDIQVAPLIFVFLEHVDKDNPTKIYLTVKNCGKGVATDIKISFDPQLKPSEYFDLNHIKELTEFIPVLPPGEFIRHGFASTIEYLNNPDSPLTYNVNIKYKGGIFLHEREINQQISMDFFTRGTRANRISEIT